MIDTIKSMLSNDNINLVLLCLTIGIFIWGVYNKIKFLCLQKASEMVAAAEKHNELSGKEKFSLVLIWINEELPKVFRNNLFKSLIEKIVQFAYETSFKYATEYIKRKTGYDVSEILETIKKINDPDEEEKKETSESEELKNKTE